ncbi:MAG: hypothetical protein JW708_10100, partial [Vallitaleaceae bacterium]|nr:hypothetical protein [Vallitaleaceae bacterium]
GHFFRGLAGQDMSGIDNIGGQVLPQQENVSYDHGVFARRDGEFYHFMLGKLASSAAAIEPLKKGNSMCEIFGAYGWSEGLRLEKYLLDHFMVRGINHFVPHAYSAKAYPDPDCPPHFYANGNHPQHRHFGELMAYTNRVCELIQGGRHIAPVAVLYHGDGEWAGDTMFSHRIGRILAEYPIDYDNVPMDIFAEREKYQTRVEQKKLLVNTQEYSLLIVPKMQYVTEAFANGVIEMSKAGVMLCFIEDYPEGLSDVSGATRVEKVQSELLEMKKYPCFELNELKNYLEKIGVAELVMEPSCKDLRYYHYEHHEGLGVYLFVNEGTSCYEGKLGIQEARKCLIYNAWENRLEELPKNNSGEVFLRIEPLKSLILLADDKFIMLDDSMELCKPLSLDVIREMTEVEINPLWKRSTCRSIDYPKFDEEKEIFLPDRLADAAPEFSGFVRYENSLFIDYADNEKLPNKAILEIGDAYEGVEVFVNETSLGIQIIPPFIYDVEKALKPGVNTIVIEVATSLEREMAKMPDMFGRVTEATTQSGITGMVRLWVE